MDKYYRLNEGQYQFILTESLHYPTILDNVKEELFDIIYSTITNMTKNKQDTVEFIYNMKDNQFFNDIKIQLIIYENDINVLKNFAPSFYYNEKEMVNNKIVEPFLMLKIPVNLNSYQKTNASALKTVLTHEFGHLYDDWISQIQGNTPFCLSTKNKEINELMQLSNETDNPFIKSIARLAYLSNETEKHSFISQIFNELELLGCNKLNWRDKYKELSSYKNYQKLYINLKNEVNNADIGSLFYVNNLILYNFKNTDVPRLNINSFDSLKYKEKLIKFIENLFNDFIHRLGGIMSYFLNEKSMVGNGLPSNYN